MKKLLSIITSIAVILAMMPAMAFAEAKAVPASGELDGNYSLTEDTLLSGTITIPKGKEVTITGNDVAKLSLSGVNIIEVKGSLVLKDVVIEANSTPGWGAICLTEDSASVKINSSKIVQNCTPTDTGYTTSSQIIQVADAAGPTGNKGLNEISISINDSLLNATHTSTGVRGICFSDASSGNVSLNNSKLYCCGGVFRASYTRGISTYQDNADRTLNISISNNSEIKGFAYPVLNGGSIGSKGKIVLDASDSSFSGWCCAELCGNYNTLNYTSCDISGVNIYSGLSNDYSLFQVSYYSAGSHNEINVTGCTLTAATKDDTTAEQNIVNFEDDSSVINFRNGTRIVQQDNRPALFQVWDEDGADGNNAKQFTFDDTVSVSGGNYYFAFIDEPYETATLCDSPVAKVYQGNTGIFTYAPALNDAVNAANDGDTIRLLDNATVDTSIPIKDKEITIDLAGHTIETTVPEVFDISGTADVTITGDGTIAGPDGDAGKALNGRAVISVSGTEASLTVLNGTITAGGADSDGMYGIYVYNGGNVTLGNKTAGPTITTWFAAVGENNTTSLANITINNGIYEEKAAPAETDLWSYLCAPIYALSSGNIVINGGTFKGYYGISTRYDNVAQNITINGGTFEGAKSALFVDTQKGDGDETPARIISVTGGTFSTDPTDYVASGYEVTGEGPYTVSRIYIPVKDSVTNSGTAGSDNATTSADMTGKVTVSDGTASAVVDQTTGDKIVDKAVENKSAEVVIEAGSAAGSAAAAEVTLPEQAVKAIAEKTDASLTIKTDNAEVTLDADAVDAVADQAGTTGTVKLIVETTEATDEKVVVELKLVTSNGAVTDFKGGNVSVTVDVPKAFAAKEVACVYIDDDGIYHEVDGVMNADGTYTFRTGHFSTYAIMAKEEADAVIAEQTIKSVKAATIKLKSTKGKGFVKLSWTKSGDADLDGYDVYRGKARTSLKRWGGTSKTTYRNAKGLKKGTTYYYKVRGYKIVDGKKVYTKWSNINYRKAI